MDYEWSTCISQFPLVRISVVQSDTKWWLIWAACHMGKRLAPNLSFTNPTRLNRCPYLYLRRPWYSAKIHFFVTKVNQGVEGWLGFPDPWCGRKPRWNWYLTPVVNFGEVRSVQLAKSTLLTSSFQVSSDTKERVGCRKQQEATAPIHP